MNNLTFSVLRLLADGQFHSGEKLAKHFKVSRATIWSAIQTAKTLKIAIFCVRGRGYQLPQAVNFLNKETVLKAFGEPSDLINLIILDQVESTNTYLMQLKNVHHATCVAAHIQTHGRGRRGRAWVSQFGASLTFSLLWRFQCGAAVLSGLSLAVGVAIMRALQELSVTSAQLKWPNDILVMDGNNHGKKLAGILIELQGDLEGPTVAVIGVGVNLNLPKEMLDNIDQPAIDLNRINTAANKPAVQESKLLGVILKHLTQVLTQFEADGFVGLRDEWVTHHAYHQKPVRLLLPNGNVIIGVVNGVADNGSLEIQSAAGRQFHSSGEISMRGIV